MTATANTQRTNLESATKSIDLLIAFTAEITNSIYSMKNTLESKNNRGEIVTADEAAMLIARITRYTNELARAGQETVASFAYSINDEATANAAIA